MFSTLKGRLICNNYKKQQNVANFLTEVQTKYDESAIKKSLIPTADMWKERAGCCKECINS